MNEVYRVAKRADGTIDLTKVPTHAEVVGDVMFGRLKSGQLQSNHTVPKYVQKLFGINQAVEDTVPSLILKQVEHTGPGAGSFHNILYRYVPKATVPGSLSNAELLSKLEQAYTDFGRPDVWEVAREWLRLQGIQ
jgi:hypothetical protein